MQKNAGFTLIELLVAATIISLMVSMGLVSYFRFNERQSMLAEAEELKQFILMAKSKAKAGIVPAGCGTLNAYIVTTGCTVGVNLCIKSDCSVINSQVSELKFNNDLISDDDIQFNAIGGGVMIDDDQALVLTSANYKYTLTVETDGDIIEGTVEDKI